MVPFWKLLQDSGAVLVLSGHDHNYERFSPQNSDGTSNPKFGITEIVVGTGGVALRASGPPINNSVYWDNASHGVLHLSLKDEGLEYQFESINEFANYDHGSLACHTSK